MIISAPAVAASNASSRLRHSTSIFDEKPAADLATFTALVMEPALQTWLSLSMTICERSSRCVAAPPTKSAYFSTTRKPGVVLRVPATWPSQPCDLARVTHFRDAVATPEARESVFSAVRSPRRTLRTGPRTVAMASLPPCGGSRASPSLAIHVTWQPRTSKAASKKGTPAKTPADLAYNVAVVSPSPTTSPPTSKDGQSSRIHRPTSSFQCGGRRAEKSAIVTA
mmetsp:Transcript_20770/g.70386  ORF Transcript_20770/g.70386 Transcript_20770/m.70386 type:complete len:225 (-) Transcript_20770:37-711(-)